MVNEEQLKKLESESQAVNKEIKKILLDIRIFLMETGSPMRMTGRRSTSDVIKEGASHGSSDRQED